MCSITTTMQHCSRCPRECLEARKRNVSYKDRKSKKRPLFKGDMILYRKPKISYKLQLTDELEKLPDVMSAYKN